MYLKVVLVFISLYSYFFVNSVNCVEKVIRTETGPVRGQTIRVLNKNIDQFLGIPYAAPPVGRLRFAKPQITFSSGVFDATKEGNSCMQPIYEPLRDFIGNITLSEECLSVNIWTADTSPSKLKPVMFWIHGGVLTIGSSFQKQYNGSVLATKDVVFVSINYRLGQFGFLYGGEESAPGNVGFYDQLLALKWVRENIQFFGGDMNQITIFGESAGSYSTTALLLSPLAKGLFKRAILQSGALMFNKDRPILTKEEALNAAKNLAKQLNCADDSQWLECLRTVDANQLIPVGTVFTFPVEGTENLPFTAQQAFQQMAFNKDLDIMAGINRDEGSILVPAIMPEVLSKKLTKDDFVEFFNRISPTFHNMDLKRVTEFYLNNTDLNDSDAIKWKIFDLFGDVYLKCPTYRFAKRYAELSSPETNVYFYKLTHTSKGKEFERQFGIFHAADLDFVFGHLLLDPNTSEENKRFTEEVLKLWTDFAKNGKPDNNWPKLIDTKTHSSETLIKDLNPKNGKKFFKNIFDETCDGFWKDYY